MLNNSEVNNLIGISLWAIGFIAFGIWYLVDTYRIGKYEGKIKRGIKVWSRKLSNNVWQPLIGLNVDKFIARSTSKFPLEFIRVQTDGILIYSSPKKLRSTWICIGFIDPTSPEPELEYRMSLPGLIFLVPLTVFGMLIFLVSFINYKKAIDSFIEKSIASLSESAEFL